MVYWVSRHVAKEVVIVAQEETTGSSGGERQGLGMEHPVILLGYEVIEEQAAEVAKSEAAGSSSMNTDFEMTGNEVSDPAVTIEDNHASGGEESFLHLMCELMAVLALCTTTGLGLERRVCRSR
jgi:hypothetical protein